MHKGRFLFFKGKQNTFPIKISIDFWQNYSIRSTKESYSSLKQVTSDSNLKPHERKKDREQHKGNYVGNTQWWCNCIMF